MYSSTASNFGEFEAIITPYCEERDDWCVGWSFWNLDIDGNTTTEPYYVLFNEMADPSTDPDSPGVCFASSDSKIDLEFLNWDSSYFANYSDELEAQYLEEFQKYTEDLYDTLQGLWSA